uniref:LysR family transcriptional regulator n=1 Tax=Pararhizobium sp. IMCC3301 TaxID=3067904 RepID=UPI0027410E60|nr:LysR family transcriptional regulator [Pararhizobium sp. IMCC3301]
MPFNTRRLAHFLAVVEFGSINRAAAQCHISQAGMTKSIRALEGQAGGELFERQPQGVRLTRLGKTLLRHARLLDNQLSRAAGALRAQIEGGNAEIRIGVAIRWALRQVVPQVLSAFAGDARGSRITLISDHQSWQMIDNLRNGDLDLVLATPSELDDLTGVEARYFRPDRQGVAVRRDHPLTRAKRIGLDDLSRWEWISARPETYSWRYVTGLFLAAGKVPPMPRMTIESNVLTLDVLARTDFLAIANAQMIGIDHGDRVVLLDTLASRDRKTAILTRAGDVLPKIASDVIVELGRHLGPASDKPPGR